MILYLSYSVNYYEGEVKKWKNNERIEKGRGCLENKLWTASKLGKRGEKSERQKKSWWLNSRQLFHYGRCSPSPFGFHLLQAPQVESTEAHMCLMMPRAGSTSMERADRRRCPASLVRLALAWRRYSSKRRLDADLAVPFARVHSLFQWALATGLDS